jgi:hypothetical protein
MIEDTSYFRKLFMKYAIRTMILVLFHLSGVNVKSTAKKLAESMTILFKEEVTGDN